MPTVGPIYVVTATAVSGTWSSLANSQGSGASTYATWTHSSRRDTGTWQGAGFDFSAVPAGATIDNVLVEVQHKESSTTNITPVTGQLFVNGTAVGSAVTFTESTSNRIDSWNVTSGVDQTDLSGLQVRVTATGANNTTSATESIDFARVTVTYTAASFTGSGGITLKTPTASSSAVESDPSVSGSGGITAGKAEFGSNLDTQTFTGSGGVTRRKATAVATGTEVFTGAGAPSGRKPVTRGTASITGGPTTGAGGITARRPRSSGTGAESVTITGTGSAARRRPSAAGSGSYGGIAGSGTAVHRKPVLRSSGSVAFRGSGGIRLKKAILFSIAPSMFGSVDVTAKPLLRTTTLVGEAPSAHTDVGKGGPKATVGKGNKSDTSDSGKGIG